MEKIYRLSSEGIQQKKREVFLGFLLTNLFIFLPCIGLIMYFILRSFERAAWYALALTLTGAIPIWWYYKGTKLMSKWEVHIRDNEICLYGTRAEVQIPKSEITRITESESDLVIFGKDGTLSSGFVIPNTVGHYEELKSELSKWMPIEVEPNILVKSYRQNTPK